MSQNPSDAAGDESPKLVPVVVEDDDFEVAFHGEDLLEDDIIVKELEEQKRKLAADYKRFLKLLWEANRDLYEVLKSSTDLDQARSNLYDFLERTERLLFEEDSPYNRLEKTTVREAIRVFRSVIAPINEQRTDFSALRFLWKLATGNGAELDGDVSLGFLMEFIHLFRALSGESYIYRDREGVARGPAPEYLLKAGREAAEARSAALNELGSGVWKHFKRYPSGMDPEVVDWRRENRERIMRYFGATERDWRDYRWHLTHVIKEASVVLDLIELSPEHRKAVIKVDDAGLPFGITPHYLSLMDYDPLVGYDHAVRAQVLPPPDYVDEMARNKMERASLFDFMGEFDTSPVDLVTRRYPLVCILKPFNTCAQICVYCQRNWEIDECMAPSAAASWASVREAIDWIAEQRTIGDVLITGGDPAVMNDKMVDRILDAVSAIDRVYRIRLGTRTPVVLPQRFTEKFCDILGSYREPGRREITVVTHFEHSYEITPEACDAVQRVRARGIGVYNQEVFTIENSRRFELAKLRHDLRLIGVDPYYTFNMKGKQETKRLMVPIARIMQERKEEARLLPGLDRTDEPVFNVPRMGKNHLRAAQDHRIVMIMPNGARVYEFHPWEKNIAPVPTYNYEDVPIYDYLQEMVERGENIRDYRSIWYYY